jgi:hypothetical protein
MLRSCMAIAGMQELRAWHHATEFLEISISILDYIYLSQNSIGVLHACMFGHTAVRLEQATKKERESHC